MIKNLLILLLCAAAICLGWLYINNNKAPKLAFVDTLYLYDKSDLKKHYKGILENKHHRYKYIIDSLSLIASRQNSESAAYALGKKKEELDYDLLKMEKEFDEKIWKQISELTLEYGEANHYDFIMGATGQGSLMYAAKSKNISEEVLKYINKRFGDE